MAFEGYNPRTMDHFLNPRNTGELKGATVVVTVKNEACGDSVKLSLIVEKDRILAARTRTFGCAAAIASASALTELLTGRSIGEALALRNTDVVAFLGGLPEGKEKCSVVAEQAVSAALAASRSA